jgi:energy-converting hydrogenase Eha subunit A
MASDSYKIQVSSYSISYKDSSTGNICGPVTTIPVTSCADSGVCKHTFEVSSSFCHPSTDITVTVMTINMFGSEEESDSRMIGIISRCY